MNWTLRIVSFGSVIMSPLSAAATECRQVLVPVVPQAGDFIPLGILIALVLIIINRRREAPNRGVQILTLIGCVLLSVVLGVVLLSVPETWERGVVISGLASVFSLIMIARPAPKGRISLAIACLLTLLGCATSLHALSGDATVYVLECTGSGLVDEDVEF